MKSPSDNPPVLLTVSGVIPSDLEEQIARGERPMADYLALAHACQADLLDYPAARRVGGRSGHLLEKLGGKNLMLAWACFRLRHRYPVLFTDGEQVGIPLAAMLKWSRSSTQHLMISHVLSVGKKMVFFDRLGVHSHIHRFFVYSSWQKRFIHQRWQVPDERVVLTPFMVDADFFSPEQVRGSHPLVESLSQRPMICSVGLEFRDYPTLIEAVRDLDVEVIIAAASPWSKRADTTHGLAIPPNVHIQRFSQYELRQIYAASRLLVMPLYPVQFQAGVTALLEAMAMEKAVICTRTPGQTDVVQEGETGLYVPPGDPEALRTALCHLLAHPAEAERMGRNGRQRVLQEMSLDCYTQRLARYAGVSV